MRYDALFAGLQGTNDVYLLRGEQYFCVDCSDRVPQRRPAFANETTRQCS
jgi:hypothetical protein